MLSFSDYHEEDRYEDKHHVVYSSSVDIYLNF